MDGSTRSRAPALTSVVRGAARFDRSMVSLRAGALAAVPVVAVLGGGTAAGDPVAGVTMGAGAMLVGIAWRVFGGRPPLGVMAADSLLMALSTFVGCLTGGVTWLHVIVLCLWSSVGGLLVVAGNRGGVIGTQAIIAVIVFGRFSEPAPAALGLAGLVLAGGAAQVIFLTIVRWPWPLSEQRRATASAYRVLAQLARGPAEDLGLAAGTALDGAENSLATPALLGDPSVMTLRSLVNEGLRLRIQLTAIHQLVGQASGPGDTEAGDTRWGEPEAAQPTLGRALELAAQALEQAAAALEGNKLAADGSERSAAALTELIATAGSAWTESGPLNSALERRLPALAGQIRAVAGLTSAAAGGGTLRSRRPYGRVDAPRPGLRDHFEQVRANANLQSPAGRHALRLAVVVPVTALLSRQLPLERSYWMVVAAATVLRPEFSATFTRGLERALGTCLGVGLAGLIAVALHPAGGVTVVIVGLLAWGGYSLFPASFALGFAFITAVVVFLLNAISPDTLATAWARLLDTLVGGSIGLLVYAAWPTWARTSARQALADLLAAQRAYVQAVLGSIEHGRRLREAETRELTRRARLARTSAEAAVGRSLSEPSTRRIDAAQTRAALGAMRRLIQAAHVLRLDAQDERPRRPHPELASLRSDLDRLLSSVQERLLLASGDPGSGALPDLRADYDAVVSCLVDDGDDALLQAELDEIVDAANGLAVAAGFTAIDSEAEPQAGRLAGR